MAYVVLVRHGESELNASNRRGEKYFCGQFETPLTDRGKQQARDVGKQLALSRDVRIQFAVSSALRRAVETLQIITSELPPPLTILPPLAGFNERSLGEFEGRTEAEVYREFPQYRDNPNFNRFRSDFHQRAPGGENLSEVSERVWATWQAVQKQISGDILIVAHSKSIQTWLGMAQNLTTQETLKIKVPNASPIIVASPRKGPSV